jgi:hypothetical protein
MNICMVATSWFLVNGCTTTIYKHSYISTADLASGISLDTGSGDKLQGNWALVLDESIETARRSSMKPTSYTCSTHDYSFDASGAIASMARKMANQLFETLIEDKEAPTSENAMTNRLVGAIVVKLDDFDPAFTCSMLGYVLSCSGSADISVNVTLIRYQPTSTRESFSLTSRRTSDGPGGDLCSGALTVLGQATSKATKDVFESVAQRLVTRIR